MADRQLRIFPFEIAAWSGLVAAVVFLRSHHLRIDWVTFEYTIPPLVPVMAKYLVFGIVIYTIYLLIRRRSIVPYFKRLVTWRWWILTLRLWAAIAIFTYTYFWLKVCVPLVNERLWDAALWRLDIGLHLGFSPSLFIVELTQGTPFAGWMDHWYALWLVSVSCGLAFMCAYPGAVLRRRFILSCVLIWTLGAWLYVALPALGPIYAYNEAFQEILPQIPRANGSQQQLWTNYQTVLAGKTGGLKQFNPTKGIAAMPSLHVGVHWLLMLWSRRFARPVFVFAVVATLLTFLGSIVTGWHYAIDAYVGIGLAQVCYWIANRTERRPTKKNRPGKRGSKSLLSVIAALVALAVSLWIFTWATDRKTGQVLDTDDVRPPGRWHYQPQIPSADPTGKANAAGSSEELARVLSLPYLDAKSIAPSVSGVTVIDPGRVNPGVNLYVSGHGPEATLMDQNGEILHRWKLDFEQAFPEKRPSLGTTCIRRAKLLPNGDLLAIYQGAGMIKLDLRSNLLWSSDLNFYNDFFVEPDGTVYGITKDAVSRTDIRSSGPILEDAIVVLNSEGELVDRLSLLDAFAKSPYSDLIYPLPDYPDIFHSNTIEVMDGSLQELGSYLSQGRVLVSLREVDIVAFIDLDANSVERAWRGPWKRQHEPNVLDTGQVLIFDNLGAAGQSRVLEFDPETTDIDWEYRGTSEQPLSSPEAGSAQRLANGNTLITESERGRAIEITPNGEVVWEFVSPHRGGRSGELVATLFEVIRMETAELPFLEPGRAD